jgi:hypothetical protein
MTTVNLPVLNFPHYEFRIAEENGQLKIFDPVRKKFVALTPEEWVRQHVIQYLYQQKGYPLGLMMVEKEFNLNGLSKRADVVVCNTSGTPILMVECKSPSVQINQQVFDQAMRYNLTLNVELMLCSNGMEHYCFELGKASGTYTPLTDVPAWSPKK